MRILNSQRNRTKSVISALVAATALGGCVTTDDVTCPHDFTGPVSSLYGDARIDNLFDATGRFSVAAVDLNDQVLDTCNRISTDLGGATGADVTAACTNASDEITAVLSDAAVTINVQIIPPICTIDVDAYVDCAASFDADFDVTATPPRCEGGMLSGSCSGMCSGSCTAMGSVECSGSCSGSCSGQCTAMVEASCTGTCMGQCEGECTATDEMGNCVGECTGTCRGMCDGTIEGECTGQCMGSCEGSCRADIEGSCMGQCSGSCDVDFVAPRCEGGELEVDANVECQASCDSDVSIDAECTEPEIVVSFSGEGDVADLIATLEANLPSLLSAAEKAGILVQAGVDLASGLGGATSAALDTSLQASICLVEAVDAQVAAAANVQITIEASVMVSGSVSASAE